MVFAARALPTVTDDGHVQNANAVAVDHRQGVHSQLATVLVRAQGLLFGRQRAQGGKRQVERSVILLLYRELVLLPYPHPHIHSKSIFDKNRFRNFYFLFFLHIRYIVRVRTLFIRSNNLIFISPANIGRCTR